MRWGGVLSVSLSFGAFACGGASNQAEIDGTSETAADEGSSSAGSESDGSGSIETESDTSSDDTSSDDTSSDTASDETSGGDPLGCSEATGELAGSLTSNEGGCTVIVRFEWGSLAPIGWSSVCGPLLPPQDSLDAAQALALADFSEPVSVVSPMSEKDHFLIYQSPGDFGGFAFVSNHLGTLALRGGIVWAGMGELQIPETWNDPATLGQGCGAEAIDAVGYHQEGQPLDAAEIDAALAALADTAVLPAIAQTGSLARAFVLDYQPTQGTDRPVMESVEEYLVVLETKG